MNHRGTPARPAGVGRAALRLLVLGWVVALLAGCALRPAAVADLSPSVAQHFSPTRAPGRYINQPVWLRGGSIVVVFDPAGSQHLDELQMLAVKADGSAVTPLPLPADPDCAYTSSNFPTLLPDGRLGYVQECFVSLAATRELPQQATRLMAYDPATGAAGPLFPYYVPINTNAFAFSPDMRRGVLEDGNGLYEQLEWLLPDRAAPLPLPLTRAGLPAWSPDGRAIALDGAPDAQGHNGVDRLDLPRTLYLLSPDGAHLRPLLSGFTQTVEAAWSPDGRWLAANLSPSGEPAGLWLIEAATGKRYLLLRDPDVGGSSWSPDGRHIVVTVGQWAAWRPGEKDERVGLLVLDLPDLGRLATSAAR